MKAFIWLFLFLFTSFAYSQQDSALLVYKHTTDPELKILYDMLDVEYNGICCQDTTLKGKSFLLSCDEYYKGKLIHHDDMGMKDGIDTMQMVTGSGDTIYYLMDHSSHTKFEHSYKDYLIAMMAKPNGDSIDIKIHYPGIYLTKRLKGKKDFSLRSIAPCGTSDSIFIPLNKATAVMAFAPPVAFGVGGSYCLLGLKDVKDWYKEFKIEHYYIFNLLIK